MRNILTKITNALYILALLVTTLSIVYLLLLLLFGWEREKTIYWLAVSAGWIWEYAFPLFIGASLYFIAILLIFRDPLDRVVRKQSAYIVLLAFLIGIVLWGTYMIYAFQAGSNRHHLETVSLSNTTYYLQFFSMSEAFNDRYILYECPFNIFCDEIYTVSRSNGIDPAINEIEMLVDDIANTVMIKANGAIVFAQQN